VIWDGMGGLEDVRRGSGSASLRSGRSLFLWMRGHCCWVVGSAWLREGFGLSVGLGGVDVAVCFDCHCHMRMEGLCREILRGLDSCGVSSFRASILLAATTQES
jgi:hypothetical protein